MNGDYLKLGGLLRHSCELFVMADATCIRSVEIPALKLKKPA